MRDRRAPERAHARKPGAGLSRLDGLAVACVLLWSAGAALTHAVGIWAGIGGAAIGLGVATLCLARSTIAPRLRPSGRLLAGGLAAAAVMLGATYGLFPLLRHESPILARELSVLYATFRAVRPLWVARLLLPVIILSEELVWRGVVLEALGRRLSPNATIVLGSLAYAAAHAPAGSWLLTAIALVCGVFWSFLRVRTRSLVPSLLSHLLWDASVMILWPLG